MISQGQYFQFKEEIKKLKKENDCLIKIVEKGNIDHNDNNTESNKE